MTPVRADIVLGMDLGTSSCKVCAVNYKGHKLFEQIEDYPSFTIKTGWAEQDPLNWIESLSRATRTLLNKNDLLADQVKGISLSTAAHIAVLLDNKDEPLRKAILWNDQRSYAQAERLAGQYGPEIYELTNNWVSSTWTLPHLVWVRDHEPSIWQKIRRILLSKDFVAYYFTGNRCTDPATAVSSMLFDATRQKWSERLCFIAGIKPDILPKVHPVSAKIGELKLKPARQFGLNPGTAVINGTLDSTAETFSAKAIKPGDMVLRLASAGGVHLLVEQPQIHPKLIAYPYPLESLWMVQAGTNSCATAVQWARKVLSCGNNIPYSSWDALVTGTKPGASGLIFHPYLSGERCPHWDDKLRASFIGLSFKHEMSHFARAVYEGAAFSIKDALGVLKDFNIKQKKIAIIGGGAKSDIWCSIVCDVLGTPMVRIKDVDSSYGAALIGLFGIGVFPDLNVAQNCADFTNEYLHPKSKNHAFYQSTFKKYQKIQRALQLIYH